MVNEKELFRILNLSDKDLDNEYNKLRDEFHKLDYDITKINTFLLLGIELYKRG